MTSGPRKTVKNEMIKYRVTLFPRILNCIFNQNYSYPKRSKHLLNTTSNKCMYGFGYGLSVKRRQNEMIW